MERRFPGAGPASRVETCLYTTRSNDEFVLERKGRVVIGSPCSGHGFKFAPVVGKRLAALALEVRSSERGRARRDDDVVAGARPAHVDAADDRGRDPVRLPEDELRGARELVGDGDLRGLELVADAVADASEVEERRDPAAPSATSVVP